MLRDFYGTYKVVEKAANEVPANGQGVRTDTDLLKDIDYRSLLITKNSRYDKFFVISTLTYFPIIF